MATSGSSDFSMTGTNLVTSSFRKIGVISDNETASGNQLKVGLENLNLMLKSWSGKGVQMPWKVDWATRAFTDSVIVTGSDANAYRCVRSHTSSTAREPVTGVDYTTYWQKTDEVSGGAWADATVYGSSGDFELGTDVVMILDSFVRDGESSDCKLDMISREEYMGITNKGNTSNTPTCLWLERKVTPKVWVYPQPNNDTTAVLHMNQVKLIEDFDTGAEDSDFHARWYLTVIYGLASLLVDDYGISTEIQRRIGSKARALLKDLQGTEREIEDTTFISSAY